MSCLTFASTGRLGLAVSEMLDIGYTHTWIAYLMDVHGVPKTFARPVQGRSKYLFCKDLFGALGDDPRARHIVADIAGYILKTERFDKRLETEAQRHLPWFREIVQKAGLSVPGHQVMRVSPVFAGREFALSSSMCFVLMPFRELWSDRMYGKILKPILVQCQLDPKRADDLFGSNIMEDIWAGINAAFVVVADVTGRNANVFYELGIAHTLGKNVIILTQDEGDIPFDIRTYRHITYEDNQDGYETLQERIPGFVDGFYGRATEAG